MRWGLSLASCLGVVPQLLKDFGKITSESLGGILSTFASIIAPCIQAVRQPESASLQQEVLWVVKELKFTKFSVPIAAALGRARYHDSSSLIDMLFTHEISGIQSGSVFETTGNWYADVPERKELIIV